MIYYVHADAAGLQAKIIVRVYNNIMKHYVNNRALPRIVCAARQLLNLIGCVYSILGYKV